MKNDNNYVFNYKNENNISFLTVGVNDPGKLVHYQVKMMENNSIPVLLPMSISEHNGSYELFYDITSRISMEQVLSRRSLSEEQCLKLIEAFSSALDELPEYQLSTGGIVVDLSYIFVRPGDFDVSFVFIPDGSEENGIEEIRNLLSMLVMKNKIAAGSGQFISSLLTVLNTEKLDAELLKKFCKNCRNKNQGNRRTVSDGISDNSAYQYINVNNAYERHGNDENNARPAGAPERPAVKAEKQNVMPELPENNIKKGKKRKTKKEKALSENKNTKNRILFILIQGALVILAGLAVQNGLITSDDGRIDIIQCAGLLLIFVLLDFLIYRRMFKSTDKSNSNTKETADKKMKTKKDPSLKNKKNGKNKKGQLNHDAERLLPKSPFSSNRAPDIYRNAEEKKSTQIPNQKNTYNAAGNNVRPVDKRNVNDVNKYAGSINNMGNINNNRGGINDNRAGMMNNNNIYRSIHVPAQNNEEDYDMTVVMGDAYSKEARFTWYVNGMAHRVKMTGNDMLAGRQKDRVDIFIQSRMVGHIHAEFRLRADGEYTVTDCNSKNGTYINGSPTRIASNKEYVIHNGDTIRLADTELTFEC